jgi:hypothetical protein
MVNRLSLNLVNCYGIRKLNAELEFKRKGYAIPQGYQDLFGVVSEVGAKAMPSNLDTASSETGRWMQIQLIGESVGNVFERGILAQLGT